MGVRGVDGRFVVDDSLEYSILTRPSLRVDTKRAIEASSLRNSQGFFVSQESGRVIREPQYGHIAGTENRRIIAAANELRLSQSQLNNYVNARPQFFRKEEARINLAHGDEVPGNGNIGHIINDMEDYFDLLILGIMKCQEKC